MLILESMMQKVLCPTFLLLRASKRARQETRKFGNPRDAEIKDDKKHLLNNQKQSGNM